MNKKYFYDISIIIIIMFNVSSFVRLSKLKEINSPTEVKHNNLYLRRMSEFGELGITWCMDVIVIYSS